MSTFLLPNTPNFCPESFAVSVVGNIHMNTSPMNGSMQTVEFPGDRRLFTLQYGPQANADRAPLRAFWNRFRGQAHLLQLWNLAQPVPRGTLRFGATHAAAGVGANWVTIFTANAETLLPGDWIGLSLSASELFTTEVMEASGSGTLTVHISPPLRRAITSGGIVYTERPGVLTVLTAAPVIPHGKGSVHGRGIADGFTVECVEFL